jgi:hypothetical protein
MRFLALLSLASLALAAPAIVRRDGTGVDESIKEVNTQLVAFNAIVTKFPSIKFDDVDDKGDALTEKIQAAIKVAKSGPAIVGMEGHHVVAALTDSEHHVKMALATVISKKSAFGKNTAHIKEELESDQKAFADLVSAVVAKGAPKAETEAVGKTISAEFAGALKAFA